jgi:hypothetical protein
MVTKIGTSLFVFIAAKKRLWRQLDATLITPPMSIELSITIIFLSKTFWSSPTEHFSKGMFMLNERLSATRRMQPLHIVLFNFAATGTGT